MYLQSEFKIRTFQTVFTQHLLNHLRNGLVLIYRALSGVSQERQTGTERLHPWAYSYPSRHSFTGTRLSQPSPSSIVRGLSRVQVVTGQHQAPAVVLLIRAVKQSHHSHELSVFIHGHIERHATLGITSSDFDASTSSLSIVSALRSSVW